MGETIDAEKARLALAANEATAIDVREKKMWVEGHIPGAHHVPEDEWGERGGDLPGENKLIIACEDGRRSAELAEELSDGGREAVALDGGMEAWRSADCPMQPSTDPDEDVPI
jgi:rhodanese-related sulfurtransferase